MSFQTAIVSIVIMILLGVLLKYLKVLKTKDSETLNKIVVNIALPCMIFNALYSSNISSLSSFSILTLTILLCSLIVGIIAYFVLKFLGYSPKTLWSILIVVVLANTGFLGYPVCQGVFGLDGLVRAAFCDLSTSITFILVSVILILIFDGSIKVAIKKIITFMPLWGMILGILLNLYSVSIGDIGLSLVDYLGGATVPLIMISLGLSLNLRGFKNNLKAVSITSVLKLIIWPLIAFIILTILGVSGLEFKTAIIEAAMPSAMLSLILAINFNLDTDLTSDCIFANTLISLITIPAIIALFII